MRLRRWLWLPVLLILLVPVTRSSARRAIPDDNLAYPVLITLPKSSGSGFFLSTATRTYLVTAAHVLFDPDSGKLRAHQVLLQSQPRDLEESGENQIHLDLAALSDSGSIIKHPTHDAAVIHIGNNTPKDEDDETAKIGNNAPKDEDDETAKIVKFIAGVRLKKATKSGILVVAVENVKRLGDVLTANEVFVFGYPMSIGLKDMPQIDYGKPLLRRGVIAGKNPSLGTLILDCPVYPGNSGGPVLEVEQEGLSNKFRVVGIVSEYVPFAEIWVNKTHGYKSATLTNSGYSVAVSMDKVLELLPEEK